MKTLPNVVGRRWSDRFVVTVLCLAIVLLLAACVLSVSALRLAGRVESVSNRQNAAIQGGCDRLQRLRDDLNLSNDGQYRVIRAVVRSGTNETIRVFYAKVLGETYYSPPTDCAKAVNEPENYKAPPLVPFSWVACRFTPSPQGVHVDPGLYRPAPLPQCPEAKGP